MPKRGNLNQHDKIRILLGLYARSKYKKPKRKLDDIAEDAGDAQGTLFVNAFKWATSNNKIVSHAFRANSKRMTRRDRNAKLTKNYGKGTETLASLVGKTYNKQQITSALSLIEKKTEEEETQEEETEEEEEEKEEEEAEEEQQEQEEDQEFMTEEEWKEMQDRTTEQRDRMEQMIASQPPPETPIAQMDLLYQPRLPRSQEEEQEEREQPAPSSSSSTFFTPQSVLQSVGKLLPRGDEFSPRLLEIETPMKGEEAPMETPELLLSPLQPEGVEPVHEVPALLQQVHQQTMSVPQMNRSLSFIQSELSQDHTTKDRADVLKALQRIIRQKKKPKKISKQKAKPSIPPLWKQKWGMPTKVEYVPKPKSFKYRSPPEAFRGYYNCY